MTTVEFSTVVDLPHPPRTVFTYLVEPRNRPEWQSSLLSVRLADRGATPEVGMTWTDTTMAGVRPEMTITELKPYRLFTEVGRWRGVTGVLTMRMVAVRQGCRITVEGTLEGSGPWAVAVRAAGLVAGRALASDLRRAGRILTDRGPR